MSAISFTSLEIFIIDDNATALSAISGLLRSKHAKVQEFVSAELFLEAYEGQPGLLLCDVRMPGMTGLELQETLARRDVFLPIVMMSGFCDTRLVVTAVRNGATTVLPKPFSDEELFVSIHEAITDYRSRFEHYNEVRDARLRFATLTAAEGSVIRLLKEGYSQKETAVELGVTVRTIRLRYKNIFKKMRVENFLELIRQIVLVEMADADRLRLQNLGRVSSVLAAR